MSWWQALLLGLLPAATWIPWAVRRLRRAVHILQLEEYETPRALRWARVLRELGHHVAIETAYDGAPCDLLLALHAKRSAAAVFRFHEQHPDKPVIAEGPAHAWWSIWREHDATESQG